MKQIVIAFCLLLGASLASAASPAIEVEALFTDAAVITVDGQRKMIHHPA
jgi:hypothetical protein